MYFDLWYKSNDKKNVLKDGLYNFSNSNVFEENKYVLLTFFSKNTTLYIALICLCVDREPPC